MLAKNSCAMLMLAMVTAVSLNTTVSAQAQSQTNVHDHRKQAPSGTAVPWGIRFPGTTHLPATQSKRRPTTVPPGRINPHDHRNKAPMNQKEAVTDRFDVKVEVLKFRSPLNADTPLNHPDVNYYYNVHAAVAGVRSRSLVRGKVIGRPMRSLNLSGTIQFRNIEKVDLADRLIRLSANVTAQYRNRTDGKNKTLAMDKASGATSIDLFKMADQSQNDQAVQTVLIRNRNYLMIVRVTVTELD
jgi:hypothetical protein